MSEDFPYLSEGDVYLDMGCQALRPQPVIDALNEYYTQFNSCGERVRYKWGRITDEKVDATRQTILDYLKLKNKDYFVSFTLNTTYGLNLILSQLKTGVIEKVMTSDIEHNSPFLSTIVLSKRLGIPREVMTRNDDGSINVDNYDFAKALVVVNNSSNIDGRRLENLDELIKKIHKQGGYIVVDAAQGMSTSSDLLEKTEADAICFSAHKLYAPSGGAIIMRKDFLPLIDTTFIGGGMVDDVADEENYILASESPNHIYTKFEPGVQAAGEIIGLGAAIEWLEQAKKTSHLSELSEKLYKVLQANPHIHIINSKVSPTITWYHDKLDSHLLAEALSDKGIMVRSGYFCCHYYLDKVKGYPPLVRMALGLHSRESDIEKVKEFVEGL